jgi:hypothetical protein
VSHLLLDPPFFSDYFVPTTLLTEMTGISLHMQWPLTSQSHDSFLKEKKQLFDALVAWRSGLCN